MSGASPLGAWAGAAAVVLASAAAVAQVEDGPERPRARTRPATTAPVAGESVGDLVRGYAQCFAPLDGDYVACPSYDPRYPSSRGVTVEEALEHTARLVTPPRTSFVVPTPQKVRIPLAEAQALAMPLPELAGGEYGFVQSCLVERVLGPDDMLVGSLALIDATALQEERSGARRAAVAGHTADSDAAFVHRANLARRQSTDAFRGTLRLRGFSTAGVTERKRWTGPAGGEPLQIAVVRTVPDPVRRGQKVFEAVPAAWFRRGVTSEQFRDLLAKRQLTAAQFAEIVAREARQGGDGVKARVVAEVEARRPAPPPETAPAPQAVGGRARAASP